MARYDDSFSVDLVIVGAGAGGGTLAQRLARRGLEGRGARGRPVLGSRSRTGCPTRPARTGSTGPRSGSPAARIRSSSARTTAGHGVGGSMVHYAGYCPRFHPSDFEVRSRDGVGEDWPISLRRPQAPLRAPRARAAGGRRLLALGRPAPLPAHAASDRRRRRRSRARAPAGSASRCASGRSGSPTARSATVLTASTAASACRAARSTPRPRRWSPTSPTRSSTAPRSARTAWPRGSRSTRRPGA